MEEPLGILRSRIDSELRRARVAGDRTGGMPPDLPTQLEALAMTLRKLYPGGRYSQELGGFEVRVIFPASH